MRERSDEKKSDERILEMAGNVETGGDAGLEKNGTKRIRLYKILLKPSSAYLIVNEGYINLLS